MSSTYRANIHTLITSIKSAHEEFTLATVLPIVVTGMEAVEQFPGLSGAAKKNLVMDAVKQIMQSTGSNTGLDAVLDELVPQAIDQLITASKDGLALNPRIRGCFSC